MSYTIFRKPGRGGRYLTAAWASTPQTASAIADAGVRADGAVAGVDLIDGHLAARRLDEYGNPVGRPERIGLDLSGSSARRDAQVRHAVTRLIHYAARHRIETIAVEDLDFADARTVGRETMGRGSRGKRFRKTVSSIPTAVFRNRLSAQTSRHGVRLYAVRPGTRGTKSRPPDRARTRHLGRATVTPAPANTGQLEISDGNLSFHDRVG